MMRESMPVLRNPSLRLTVFVGIVAYLAAVYAGTLVVTVAADLVDPMPGPPGNAITTIARHAAQWVIVPIGSLPFSIIVTFKPAVIFVIIGELLRRASGFYPIGGALLGFWEYLIVTTPFYGMHPSSWLSLTYIVAGCAAGSVFWYVGVRNFRYDFRKHRPEEPNET